MKIKFNEPTWVLYMVGGGFSGDNQVTAIKIEPEIFEVKSIDKSKEKQCSNIYLGSDSQFDGYIYYLINVPNGLFKQINDEDRPQRITIIENGKKISSILENINNGQI